MLQRYKILSFAPWLLALSLSCLSACTDSGKGRVKSTADYLQVRGQVAVEGGNSIAGASLTLNGTDALAITNDTGGFDFTIADRELGQVQNSQIALVGNQAADHFSIVVKGTVGQEEFLGLSRPLRFAERGVIDLGTIVLNPPAAITGKAQLLPDDDDFRPAAGITISALGVEAISANDGTYTLTGLPAGHLSIFGRAAGLAAGRIDVELKAGEMLQTEAPLVLFSQDAVNGWITPLPAPSADELRASGRPFMRRFASSYPESVVLMRWHHDPNTFEAEGERLWQPAKRRFSYDFPGNGGHNLYVQFADATRERVSPILTVQVTVDQFPDTTGIVLGDGSGLLTSRNASVTADLPAAATAMRCHHELELLPEAESIAAEPVFPYVFPRPRDPASDVVTLYCQFLDAQDNSSVVYQATAELNLFPPQSERVLIIEDDIETTPNRVVKLAITVPPNAQQMRIFEPVDNENLGGQPGSSVPFGSTSGRINSLADRANIWLDVRSEFFYTFFDDGLKQVFIQFRDADGALSPHYSDTIRVLPFPPGEEGFLINDGAPATALRDVTLSLIPPHGAVAFRFNEGEIERNQGWLELRPALAYTVRQVGNVQINLEYRNLDGEVSPVYAQTINVDPYGGAYGDVLFNGGDPVSRWPVVPVDIVPPVGAIDMAIFEGDPIILFGNRFEIPAQLQELVSWEAVRFQTTFRLERLGTNQVHVAFRNIYGDITPLITTTLVFDPFPPDAGAVVAAPTGPTDWVGAPTTLTRDILLRFDLPPNAVGMAVSDRRSDVEFNIQDRAFAVTPELDYVLPQNPGTYTIYVRYITLEGFASPIYQDTITLDYFDTPLTMSINNGDATTTNPDLNLSFGVLPPAASHVRISTDSSDTCGVNGTEYDLDGGAIIYTVDSAPGAKRLWAWFRTIDGECSGAFTDSIELQ